MATEITIIQHDINDIIKDKIEYVQLDNNSRILQFEVTDRTSTNNRDSGDYINLNDCNVYLIARKKSGEVVMTAGEILDADNGQFRFVLSQQALAETGEVKCQYVITGPDTRLSSREFTIDVKASLAEDIKITSSTELTALTEALQDATAASAVLSVLQEGYAEYTEQGGTLDIADWVAQLPPGAAASDDTKWYEIDLSQYTLVLGSISTSGSDSDTNTKRCKMRYPVFVYAGTKIKFSNGNSAKGATLHIYDMVPGDNKFGYTWAEYATGFTEYTVNRDCYIRLVFLNDIDITEDTYAEMLSSLTILSPLPPLQQIEGEPMPYFRKEIRDVAQKVGAESGLKLATFTDVHCYHAIRNINHLLGYTHFRNIKAVAESTHIDTVVGLGDLTLGYSYGSITRDVHSMISKWGKSLPSPYLQADGNHDENYYYAFGVTERRYDQILTPQELASFYYHPNDEYQRSYFYHDIPEHNTRIIVLNANDAYVTDENGNPIYNKEEPNAIDATYAFMPQQVYWLAQLLHDTEQQCTGWDIVVCSHQSVCPTGSGSTQIPKNTEAVWGLLTAFNSGSSYTADVSDGDFSVTLDETYNGNCQIPCTLHGHKHYDRAFQEDGIWNICIASSVCQNGDTTDDGATFPERTPYTVSEDAWDVCCISSDKIKMIRFGAGEDREFIRS